MKKIIFSAIILILFLPTVTLAAIDQRCFAKSDCIEARENYAGAGFATGEAEEGFLINYDDCPATMYSSGGDPEPAGFCAPSTIAKLGVGIGAKKQFGNVAEYIAYVYRYSMVAAITLAVIMIIVGGIERIASAGDATKIGSSKKKISGAIVGLVLLATSYTILNTINPALVNLRLPQVWMIRGDEIAEPFCSDIQQPLALAFDPTQLEDSQRSAEPETTDGYTSNSSTARCSKNYFIAGTGGQICQGSACPMSGSDSNIDPNQLCLPLKMDGGQVVNEYNCETAQIAIHFKINSLMQSILEAIPGTSLLGGANEIDKEVWLDEEIYFYTVCQKAGENENLYLHRKQQVEIDNIKLERRTILQGPFTEYLLLFKNFIENFLQRNYCESDDILKGVIFDFDIDDSWTNDDVNLFVSASPNIQRAVVGTWRDVSPWDNNHNGYIKIEDIRKGIYLDVSMSDSIFGRIFDEDYYNCQPIGAGRANLYPDGRPKVIDCPPSAYEQEQTRLEEEAERTREENMTHDEQFIDYIINDPNMM